MAIRKFESSRPSQAVRRDPSGYGMFHNIRLANGRFWRIVLKSQKSNDAKNLANADFWTLHRLSLANNRHRLLYASISGFVKAEMFPLEVRAMRCLCYRQRDFRRYGVQFLLVCDLHVRDRFCHIGWQTTGSRAEKLAPFRRHHPVATCSRCGIQRRDPGRPTVKLAKHQRM